MPITNFPNGVSSFGQPLLGGSGMTLPLMGGRIAAGNEAKNFFVDGANGAAGNTGLDPFHALATVTQAYAKTVDKRGDVIYLLNDGNTSGTSRDTATITWSNDNTHLIGLCSPTMLSQRSRISPPTSASAIVTPQLTVSGHGNIFSNISLFEGTNEAADSTCVSVTGNRNYFSNVAMMNMANATASSAADRAGSETLLITGGEENVFDGCYIGMDTAARSAANANVRFASAATRNMFRDCFFPMQADAASPLFIDANSSGAIDRYAWFKNCMFHNGVNSTATTVSLVASVHSSAGGSIILQDCASLGATEWETTASGRVFLNMPIPDAAEPAGGTMVVFST